MTENPSVRDDGPPGPDGGGGFEILLAAAVRSAKPRDGGEEQAVAAFREARDQGAHSARTRRRDDWRPRRRGLNRWSVRTAVGALLASVTLGGVAMAGIGAGGDAPGDDGERRATPRRSATDIPERHSPDEIRPPGAAPARPGTTAPGRSGDHPDQAGDTLAKCHAYGSVRNRGAALDSPAWQRFLAEAGGEASVDAYCAAEAARQETGDGNSGNSGNSANAPAGKADGPQNGHASPSAMPGRSTAGPIPGRGKKK
ncbi:hypothetical protein [Streptomyces sp. NPDC048641]|uniref:hypothetical protein n=1 Tax=Streptomyces sp. NPDC048641 TaxID=3154825 RepID=UPI00342226C3